VDARLRIAGSTVDLRFRQRDIYVIGEILHDRVYQIRSPLPPQPVIIDAGANIGLATLWFAATYPGAHLHCFEPESAAFALLEHNVHHIPRARCQRAALGARTGEISLHVTENGSDHSVFDTGIAARTDIVPSLRLGEYLEAQGVERVDLLKLDVEGSELAVLEGLGEHVDRVGTIVGEFHGRLVDEGAFYRLLRHQGYGVVARWHAHAGKDEHMFEVARHGA
jgi:FkbM family methyltransferase